jgi:hypothetical protein
VEAAFCLASTPHPMEHRVFIGPQAGDYSLGSFFSAWLVIA